MAKNKKRKNRSHTEQQPPASKAVSSHMKKVAAPKPSRPGGTRLMANITLLLCGAGLLLTAYLSYLAWFGEHPAYCSAGSGCDAVQSSRWSTFLGLPMAFWGFLTYAALTFGCWTRTKKPSRWSSTFLIAVCGIAISTYLTVISVVSIQATCPYCLASYAIITAIGLLLALTIPSSISVRGWKQIIPTPLIVAAVLIAGLHFHYSGLFDPAAGPESPRVRALALHLDSTGAKFYGAFWCPRCQEQKAMFEASVDRLPYVECSPNGRNGPASGSCAIKGVTDYPTWIIRGQRHVGLQTLQKLEAASNFAFDP